MRPIYVTYGHSLDGPRMFVITSKRTRFGNWRVEICPCDWNGNPVSDPIEWDICAGLFSTIGYIWKLYKEYSQYVNRH